MATRKNRSENGSRAVPKGSNPHSKGESFSESGTICGSQKEISNITRIRAMMIRAKVMRILMYHSLDFNQDLVIGSH